MCGAANGDDGARPIQLQAGYTRAEFGDRHVDRTGDVTGPLLGGGAHIDKLRRR